MQDRGQTGGPGDSQEEGTDLGTGDRQERGDGHGDRGQTGGQGTDWGQAGHSRWDEALGVACPMTRGNQPLGLLSQAPSAHYSVGFLFCLWKATRGEGPTHQVPETSRPQLPPGPQSKLPVCPLIKCSL